ncbi:MAG: hypothetical protein M1449_03665 [Candidatus Thermoplasmatota archaeon]|nr:hypothetical protein [Candidatus Thermoplasmatota archaeon]
MNKFPLTVVGAEKLRAELQHLKSVERPAVIQAIAEARAQGDLSENAEYDAAKEKQGFIEGRIADLEAKLSNAQIIDPKTLDADGRIVFGAQALRDLGFNLVATRGTAQAIESAGIPVAVVNKVKEGRPHIVDMIKNGDIDFIVNVVEDKKAVKDSYAIRAEALARRVVYFTTLAGAHAACMGMRHGNELEVYSLQALHQRLH